ncbi:hypothetical protein CHS0354_040400 [Potamilus streckersoni]|uniref:receptor protein-tyrosine kinase n=1 Tax=Potamilus streckersoni TaxID=2493646 RepID=A0AAE0VMJ4_9BIVA|nr:hypothetical protein CHS0354_040400 [Potamilus streckersoni]
MALCRGCLCSWVLFLFGYFTLTNVITNARQVVLLNTKEYKKLNWTSKINEPDPPDPSNKGWFELNLYYIDNGNKELVPVYSSCYVSSRSVDNWVRTPFINVGDAKRLYVNMTFSMRRCTSHLDPGSLQQCKETYSLYYYEAERDFANDEMPAWDSTSYTLVDKIAADEMYETADQVVFNKEIRDVSLLRGLQGVYFAFQDEGACVTLVSISIYYLTCSNTTTKYAFFPETPTAGISQQVVEKAGRCVDNAEQVTVPKLVCMGDGTWMDLSGDKENCECRSGYEGFNGERCQKCATNKFKWELGNNLCRPCPANSFTSAMGSMECFCIDGYYRADSDPKSDPCTRPPSAPRDLIIAEVTDMTVTLRWNSPVDTGGRTDITYRIECPDCGSNVMVSPKQKGFNTTSATLSNLTPSTTYKIIIYAENGVSIYNQNTAFVAKDVTTDISVPAIVNMRAVSIGSTSVTIAWDLHEESRVPVDQFEVVHYMRGQPSASQKNYTQLMTFSFKDLPTEQEYVFKVRGQTQKGWGQYSDELLVKTGSVYGKIESGNDLVAPLPSVGIIVGAVVAVLLCMAIATIMIVLLLRRSRHNNDLKSADCDTLHYSHVTMPLFHPATNGSVKTYVDPHTYEDPNQAVREFTKEIDPSHITIESVIGGGEFGDVCKGKLRIPSRPEMMVAIKTLKPGATDKNRLDFLTEASIMGQFDDPNVIFLEGVVTKGHPIMIVTEYMANGSLDTFLRNNDGRFTVIQLVGMMRGISSGMRYLSEMGYVHRDLAARNILVTENLVCKVADFGLSREVDIDTTDGAYTTKGGKIPVRWTAPEAIAFRKFTSASDVWSYSVVMWEIISYGERPYWNWSNQDVIKAVERGYRLPPPMECPEAIYQLMLDCWQKDRGNRPKFQQIVKTLDKLIRAPELLRKFAKPRPQHFVDTSPPPDSTNFSTVEEWLVAIKMERYIDNFHRAGLIGVDQVVRLTVKDLDALGITLLGHQKKIMNSIQTRRVQILGPQLPQMSEGFLV